MKPFFAFKTLKYLSKIMLIILLTQISISCATNPALLYPEYSNQSKNISNISLIYDSFFITNIAGKIKKIEMPIVNEFDKIMLRKLNEGFKEKGFKVNETYRFNGLIQPNETQYYIQTSHQVVAKSKMKIGNPPFIIDPKVEQNIELQHIFKDFIFTLHQLRWKAKGKPNNTVNLNKKLKQKLRGKAVAVVQVFAVKIPQGKAIGQGLATGILSLGMGTSSQKSKLTARLQIVDINSGEVIWDDFFWIEHDPEAFIAEAASKSFFDRLPSR